MGAPELSMTPEELSQKPNRVSCPVDTSRGSQLLNAILVQILDGAWIDRFGANDGFTRKKGGQNEMDRKDKAGSRKSTVSFF